MQNLIIVSNQIRETSAFLSLRCMSFKTIYSLIYCLWALWALPPIVSRHRWSSMGWSLQHGPARPYLQWSPFFGFERFVIWLKIQGPPNSKDKTAHVKMKRMGSALLYVREIFVWDDARKNSLLPESWIQQLSMHKISPFFSRHVHSATSKAQFS